MVELLPLLLLLPMLLFLLVTVLAIRMHELGQRLTRLEQRLGEPEKQAPPAPLLPTPASRALESPVEPPRLLPPPAALSPPASAVPPAPPAQPPGLSPSSGPPAPTGNESWRRLERTLIENWTGILGVVVLVAGVTFLAVSIALRLGPLARFLLTLLVALALILPSALWGRRHSWRRLSLWMRSGGAALILFACVAAGGLPELGLRWLNDPSQALALLMAGMALNLALAAVARQQTTASLHVVVNLLPLLLGQLLPRRRAWNRHRLIVVAAYALFHGCWFMAAPPSLLASPMARAGGALAAGLVFASGLLLQHWGRPLRRALTPLRLATLLLQWGGIALALLLSRRRRRGGAPSLALADSLCAQALSMAAILSLAPLVVDPLLLLGVLLVECALFLAFGLLQGDLIPHVGAAGHRGLPAAAGGGGHGPGRSDPARAGVRWRRTADAGDECPIHPLPGAFPVRRHRREARLRALLLGLLFAKASARRRSTKRTSTPSPCWPAAAMTLPRWVRPSPPCSCSRTGRAASLVMVAAARRPNPCAITSPPIPPCPCSERSSARRPRPGGTAWGVASGRGGLIRLQGGTPFQARADPLRQGQAAIHLLPEQLAATGGHGEGAVMQVAA